MPADLDLNLQNLPTVQAAPSQRFEETTTRKPTAEEEHRRELERIKEKNAHRLELFRLGGAAALLLGAGCFFWCHPEVWATGTSLVGAAIGAAVNHLFSKKN